VDRSAVTVVWVLLVGAAAGVAQAGTGSAGDDWTAVLKTPAGAARPRGFAKLIAAADLDSALLWGPPAAKSDKDWCMLSLDLAAGQWQPLLPPGKRSWLTDRPRMRLGARWGARVRMEFPDGLLQPAPMCYFNQAAYVPTMKNRLEKLASIHEFALVLLAADIRLVARASRPCVAGPSWPCSQTPRPGRPRAAWATRPCHMRHSTGFQDDSNASHGASKSLAAVGRSG